MAAELGQHRRVGVGRGHRDPASREDPGRLPGARLGKGRHPVAAGVYVIGAIIILLRRGSSLGAGSPTGDEAAARAAAEVVSEV